MYKAYMSTIALLLALSLVSCSKYTAPETPVAKPSQPAVSTSSMESSILALINAHRRSRGLPDLQNNDAIRQQSLQHSANMATGKTAFGHNGFEQRVKNFSASVGFVTASAENVAYGSRSARQVVDGWLNSAGHRKNIEGNYNLTGIGVYADRKGVLYFTQLFARKG